MTLYKLYTQFNEIYAKLTVLQRVSIVSAAAACVVLILALVIWSNRAVYTTLYSGLGREDTVAVIDELDARGVKYKLIDDDTIEVSQDAVYNLRLELAKLGIPQGGKTGFELFDSSQFGMTEFLQDVNYQRALEGELSRTITSMDKIKEAKVHLSVPKERLFVDEFESAKASVSLRLQSGVSLSADDVRGIAFLVSGAVKDLKPESVQVVDTSGRLLSDFLSDENRSYFLTASQFEHQRNKERELEGKLNSMLSFLGEGRYIAKVTAEMDFSDKETVSEKYGEQPVLRSSHELEINSKNYPHGPTGVPGVEPNLAEPDILGLDTLSEYSKIEATSNFEIDKTVTRETKNAGVIRRLTVAVMIDDKEVSSVDGEGNNIKVYEPWSDAEMTKIRNTVAMVVGIDPTRGDAVEVTNISFDPSRGADGLKIGGILEKDGFMEILLPAMKYITSLLIIVLFYFLMIRPILKRLDKAQDVDEVMLGETAIDAQLATVTASIGDESGFPRTVEDLEREIESELDGSVPVDVDSVKTKVMLKKIEEVANDDPETIANLLKAMIKGG